MNPHTITAANRLPGLKCLRLHTRPSDAQQAVMPGHPLRREIGMVRRHENGGAAALRASLEAGGKVGPRQPRDHEIFVSLTQRSSDNRVCARRESKGESTVTFAFGSAKRERFADWNEGQLHIKHPFILARWTRPQPNLFLHDFAPSDIPTVLDTERRAGGASIACQPALEALLDAREVPKIVVVRADVDVRPSPEKAAMTQMIFREIV